MKMIVSIFILGFILTMLGAFAKLEGWSYSGEMLIAGIGLSGLGVVLALWKVVVKNKTNAA
jgi:mannose/fructose/N-acetylgalactosamine-specific phosphotransferase system component IIC